MKRKFLVRADVDIEVVFNDEIMPDEEWRSHFYSIRTLEDLAMHLAWNLGLNHRQLSMLDGWADRPDSDAEASLGEIEWVEVEEITHRDQTEEEST